MKTIAIVINTSWNIYNFRLGLLKALEEDGYRIIAIAPRDEYSEKLENLGFEYHNITINNKGTNPIEDAKLIYAFYKLYKKIKPDVLLQYTIKPNIYGSMAAGLLGIPVISNISGLGTVFLNNNISSRVARMLYKVALSVPKKVFYQNSHDKALFVQSKLVNEKKTGLLPGSGIDTELFKPPNPSSIQHKATQEQTLNFLFIARLIKDKGLVEYVEAARQLTQQPVSSKRYQFLILGDYYPGNPTAITESELHAWEKEGIINYLGHTDDVQSVIAKAACVVLPSYREGLSRVLLEAASMATPLITTDVPGCREVVEDGVNGYLCKVKNSQSLAEQMEKIIHLSGAEREQMGILGREKVIHQFDEKLVIKKYRRSIQEILQ